MPQFIEVEDKIFGPLTIKQFIYIAGGSGLAVIFYLILPSIYLSAIPAIGALSLGLALAFYKINNKPFIFMVEAATKYLFNAKLYIWKKQDPEITTAPQNKDDNLSPLNFIPHLSGSKLKDMTWDLSTKKGDSNIIGQDDDAR